MKRVIIALVLLSCILVIAALGYIRHSNREPRQDADYVENYDLYEKVFNEITVSADYVESEYMEEQFNTYNVTISYPGKWKTGKRSQKLEDSLAVYSGNDGFLNLVLIEGKSMEHEMTALNEVYKSNQPYGQTPHMYPSRMNGINAIFILPSPDQNPNLKEQAACIIKYPKPVIMNNREYKYLMIQSTKSKIGVIGKSVEIIK